MTWLGALGQRTDTAQMGTSVLTPTMRYHPSVVAQSFATLACLAPGRVYLGVGTGEAMNETPATGMEWPGPKERRRRLAESIDLMRRLWTEERVDYEGEYYRAVRATIYDRPAQPVPIYVAASGPLAAKLAGRVGDGFICTSGKSPDLYRQLLDAVEEGAAQAGRDSAAIDRMIEIKVSYDEDVEFARQACRWWAALALSPKEKSGIDDAMELERLADANADRGASRFIVSDDPAEVVRQIDSYLDLGFTNLVFHLPDQNQERSLRQFAGDVLPLLQASRAEAPTWTPNIDVA